MAEDFARVLSRLRDSRAFAKPAQQTRLFSTTMKLLAEPGGATMLYQYAPEFESAGVFAGGVWDNPVALQPSLVRAALLGKGMNPPVESLSLLRMLAITEGMQTHDALTADGARAFLQNVLARNLDLQFPPATEATRSQPGGNVQRNRRLLSFITQQLGSAGILSALVAEAEQMLLQRPIMTARVETLLRAAARALAQNAELPGSSAAARASMLIAALEGPTRLCRHHSDAADYAAALAEVDAPALAAEALSLGESMAATGLVSAWHAPLLRLVARRSIRDDEVDALLADTLALTRDGRACLAEHPDLVLELAEQAVAAPTARCIYGLSRLLERGILSAPTVASGLRRLAALPIHPEVARQLQSATGYADGTPPARQLLLAGCLSVLGQPCGMDQGHNPTCQSARAISLWSHNDPGHLLALIAEAAEHNDVVGQFEGEAIHSCDLSFGLAGELHQELDPVSLLLTPHLDKIYMEMSRRTIGRGEDGHRWVNPALHGWWVSRGFASVIDPATGAVTGFDAFVRRFHAAYHPHFNGHRDLLHAQPCGVAVTDHDGVFLGWHAVSIQRVAPDDCGCWRVYFFNPNRDKNQDWGHGVTTSISGHGEREGESSLPFEQFSARLYVFHYNPEETGQPDALADSTVADIRSAAATSWAAQRDWLD